MDISVINKNKIRVILSSQEMKDLEITYENLDYIGETTKKAMSDILLQITKETGIDTDECKLYIEVFPNANKTLTIYFTKITSNVPFIKKNMRYTVKKEVTSPITFVYDDIDNLIVSCINLHKSLKSIVYKSSVYKINKKYYLVISPSLQNSSFTIALLKEYSYKIGEGDILSSYIKEYGTPIIKSNAVNLLYKHFNS